MSIKAIITTLVLGTSSLAAAQPLTFNVDASWSTGPTSVRDHRTDSYNSRNSRNSYFGRDRFMQDNYRYQAPARAWLSLGAFRQELLTASVDFVVPRQMATVRQVMIEGTASKTRIQGIRVNYADGRSSVIETDTYIGERGTNTALPFTPNLTFNVAPGRITSITVLASKPDSSVFTVLVM